MKIIIREASNFGRVIREVEKAQVKPSVGDRVMTYKTETRTESALVHLVEHNFDFNEVTVYI